VLVLDTAKFCLTQKNSRELNSCCYRGYLQNGTDVSP